MKTIVLEIDENVVKSDWWTKEVKEILCTICPDKDNCNEMMCQVANPWCG